MGEAPLILGVSGLRGIVGESLTPEVAVRYAGAVGEWIKQRVGTRKHRPQVIVARDGRLGGEMIEHAVASALMGTGCSVRMLGVATTPTVGVACDAMRYDAALVITASHNPQQWNGIKVIIREESWESQEPTDARGTPDRTLVGARAPTAVMADVIVGRYQEQQYTWRLVDWIGAVCWDEDGDSKHCIAVKRAIERAYGTSWHELMGASQIGGIVTDSVNASSRAIDFEFFAKTSFKHMQIAASDSGVFPHTPEPTKENLSGEGGLCDAVPGLKADVGFAQDPDADRLAIVDEMGEYIGEEYTLVLAAVSLLEARKTPSVASGDTSPARAGEDQERQAVIVTNLSTSRMIDDVAARYGARVERTAVGEANVVERMKALKQQGEDVILGGEGNGGVIWPDVVYVRDSLGAMALTLALMARKGMKVSELVSWIDSMAGVRGDGYVILKRKVDIPSKDAAAPAVEAVRRGCEGEDGASIDLQDGVRVDWPGERAWVHVRASNTEPIMRLICEAPSEGAAEALLARVEGMIAAG